MKERKKEKKGKKSRRRGETRGKKGKRRLPVSVAFFFYIPYLRQGAFPAEKEHALHPPSRGVVG